MSVLVKIFELVPVAVLPAAARHDARTLFLKYTAGTTRRGLRTRRGARLLDVRTCVEQRLQIILRQLSTDNCTTSRYQQVLGDVSNSIRIEEKGS